MITTCKCQHCGADVDFEIESGAFGSATCLACGKQTPMIVERYRVKRRINPWWIIGGMLSAVVVLLIIASKYPGHVLMIVTLCVSALLYFLPSIFGFKKRNALAIVALNIFLGWSLIGWVVALVWSLTEDAPQPQIGK